jgi:aspartate kinase
MDQLQTDRRTNNTFPAIMRVFKFGGASVKDADAVRNITTILASCKDEPLVVVVSAMGKTTNALEQVVRSWYSGDGKYQEHLSTVRTYHNSILNELFPDTSHPVYDAVNNHFVEVEWVLEEEPLREFDFCYDQVVSAGEMISTRIISAFLKQSGIAASWLDARDCVRTDNTYREGKVDWEVTEQQVAAAIKKHWTSGNVVITQGFVGGTSENYTTTLGREGSDYTAAIFAYCLNAESVVIWKDVPGVLNADPKFFKDAQKLERISYLDAIELAYYGASVIHPKTIKPLENKSIPLFVKSFVVPTLSGTAIGKDYETKPLIPSFIFKTDQVLLSISAKDFSFIAEESLSKIFSVMADMGTKINLMQNSAISFSVCVDFDPIRTPALITELKKEFKVLYNDGLQLYTVRHYFPSTIEMLTEGREILLEQRSRHTAQFVVRKPAP